MRGLQGPQSLKREVRRDGEESQGDGEGGGAEGANRRTRGMFNEEAKRRRDRDIGALALGFHPTP